MGISILSKLLLKGRKFIFAMFPDAVFLFPRYEGPVIWIDTINGQSGVIPYENGTAENPVDSLADATTLATDLGFTEFMIAPGSILTLTQGYDGFSFVGGAAGWTLVLGGQSLSGATISGATVSGVCTGAIPPLFLDCTIGLVTVPVSHFNGCAITGSVICTAGGAYIFYKCYSGIAETGIDYGAEVANTDLNLYRYFGKVEIKNMGATGTDTMSLEGGGQLIINANCIAGTVAIRGEFTVIDNSGGALAFNAKAAQSPIDYGGLIPG